MDTLPLILSAGTILLAARVLGWIFQRIGQPRVVGEMTAGIVLGPSLLGRFFPGAFAHVFPSSSLPVLTALSQLGLLLFMFVVGLEVDLNRILKQRAAIVLISNFSIVLPLALGVGLATALHPQFAGDNVPFPAFALFMGTAMSITAFPVLARILKERNLLATDLGTTAISCAAIDDISAWLLLAILTAMVHSAHSWHRLAVTLLLLVAFVAIMLLPIRRLASSLESLYQSHGAGIELISVLILIMLGASWATERLGVHALFGAFMAGLVMPKPERMIAEIVARIESLSLALLLPLFFALTGLRTRIDLLTDRSLWGYTAAIVTTAVLGKLVGAALAAKATGMGWKDSLGLGVLMNTRGLVELVVLNAGLDLGVLSPTLFTMMVLMALATTFMTTPILILMKIQPSTGPQGH
ncbi:MAG TPA: cation:proton antiporter [Terriglobales bacterium]|nr:cation:proton antiporter [Terriglobales bacterium]